MPLWYLDSMKQAKKLDTSRTYQSDDPEHVCSLDGVSFSVVSVVYLL